MQSIMHPNLECNMGDLDFTCIICDIMYMM